MDICMVVTIAFSYLCPHSLYYFSFCGVFQKQYIFIHRALTELIDRKRNGLLQSQDDTTILNEIVYENTAFRKYTSNNQLFSPSLLFSIPECK